MKSLSEILQALNEQQRKAVEQTEGPVMVVAGPGTGKTQILSARIANILTKTDTDAGQILCLTYTDAGVTAMRKRLIEMMGAKAYEVRINTFHSLGTEIIRENEEVFGTRGLQPVSDLEKEQILREMLDELPSDNSLKKNKDYYYQARPLATLFRLIKTEDVDIPKRLKDIDTYIAKMPEMEEYQYKINRGNIKKGDPKTGAIEKVKENLLRLKTALQLFDRFEEKMRERKRFDFDDMLRWVLIAFRENPTLLLSYQEKFLYYLVDEFQDTNGTQAQLLYLLANDMDNNPNLFVVGDDDQSIYKFQGAEIGNILEFAGKFSEKQKTVILQQNYRSSQKILDAASSLIEKNTERLVQELSLNKNLIAANPEYKDIPDKPTLTEFANETQEAAAVSNKIQDLIKTGTAPDEIAILFRQHKQAEEIMRFLMSRQIPVYSLRAVNILEEPLVKNLLLLLDYISKESQSAFSGENLLFPLLHLECFNLEPIEIAKLSHEISKLRSGKSWREVIAEKTKARRQAALFDADDFTSNLRRTHTLLEQWIKNTNSLTVAELTEKIIANGGFLAHAIRSEDKNWNLQLLKTFFDFIKEEVARDPYLTLNRFLHTVQTMQELGISLEVKRVYGTEKGVQLTTAHSSKGREFDHVFMIGCTEKAWKEKSDKLPFDMKLIYDRKNKETSAEEESRRLFYVGMTRARKSLHISWFTEKENAARFATELAESGVCETRKALPEDFEIADFMQAQFTGSDNSFAKQAESAWLDRFLENYRMSVTHLNQYLRCPVSFYYEKVLKVPTAQNMHAGFGSAIHYTLEAWLKAAKNHPQREFWNIETLCAEFEKQLSFQRACFTDESYAHMRNYGKEKLASYYNRRIEHLKQTADYLTEQRFFTELDGLPLTGLADKVELDRKVANIIDYKTGNPQYGRKKLSPPDPNASENDSFEKRFGGDYWRQLVFYKLLAEKSAGINWTMQSGEVDFIEEDENSTEHYKLFVSEEDLDIVIYQIKQAEAGIKSKDFRKGCGEKECHWCNFEKSHLKDRNYSFELLPKEED